MADIKKIGKVFPPYAFAVEKIKIQELVQAIGDTNPIYSSKEAVVASGYRDIPCPPTFITLAFQEFTGAYLRAFEELGISLANVLHGEEEYEYIQQIYPGDTLTAQTEVESIVEKQTKSGKMDFVRLRTIFINKNGEEVLRARSLIIERK